VASRILILLCAATAQAGPWRPLEGFPADTVLELAAAGDRIRVATSKGVFLIEAHRITAAEAGERRFPDRPDAPPVIDAPVPVTCAIVFRGEIWAGTEGHGILRKRIEPLFRRHTIPTSNSVNALAAAPDGSIWCGTDRGLARITGGRVETVEAIDGRPLGVVTAVAVDRQGRVWVGSGSSFTGVYRRDAHGWRKLDDLDAYVHRISLDPSGAVWFATLGVKGGAPTHGRGAWTFSKGRFQPLPAMAELGPVRVYDVMARDPTGILWFGTLRGLAAYEGEGRLTMYGPSEDGLRAKKVWCLATAHDGSLWIGYQAAHGASRLSRGVFTHFGDAEVWDIVEGRPDVMWFATRGGLLRYDGRRWSRFRDEEGLGTAPLWPLMSRPDGSLWIGSIGQGVVHMVPRDDAPPRTTIAGVARAGEAVTVSWTGVDAWFDTPSSQLWYRWRVDGGRWSPASAKTRATVTTGARFEVQAIDRFGNAEAKPAFVSIAEQQDELEWLWPLSGATLVFAVLLIVRGRRRGS